MVRGKVCCGRGKVCGERGGGVWEGVWCVGESGSVWWEGCGRVVRGGRGSECCGTEVWR